MLDYEEEEFGRKDGEQERLRLGMAHTITTAVIAATVKQYILWHKEWCIWCILVVLLFPLKLGLKSPLFI